MKLIAEINSIKKYLGLISFLQFLHFPLKFKKDIKGILSNHLIFFLQNIQKDLPIKIPFLSSGNRYIKTFAKLPKINPNKKRSV